MKKKEVLKLVEDLIKPIINEYDLDLVDIEYVKEGSDYFLRVFIDKEEGITIDDCEKVSRKLSKALDEEDPIEHSYILEVSSPGINRPLKKDKDFIKYIGSKVNIKFYTSFNGKKELTGILKEYNDGKITIEDYEDNKLKIDRKDTALVKLSND